ncbi:uncharacterized protein NFIA_090950 [Aspergillus fischeri NRRL 181]|uniref:Uncharacterized protein n=1 Tax=Neosartorya fischeri (strain ATCC 1020 / DSM 3700 / CBS 544.65 / FGSC A1164 / JCM 1740 / NRRL 181 / WB 181) TaxID=331117 RepID=A1DID0_NEOFI|nr:uncharacterized protein NFIA_090950 [Aspergillus fischeri NRRL 181]EAW19137.1 hypothetical protein NFIA_090950 [Aspergillus fischeri NRRL 181]KAG2021514.1 hypothetical protein GB937_004853 [Aspergillus fischeri]
MASSWIPEDSSPKSSRRRGINLQKKVDELVHKYFKVKCPSPVLRDILRSTEKSDLLVSAVRLQVSLARCRSQDFNDGQVTIYDKALLTLSKNGDEPAELSVLELYLTEYLGIVPIANTSHSLNVATKRLGLHRALTKAPSSMFFNAESPNSEEPTLKLDGQVPAITTSSSEPTKESGLHSEDTKGLSEDLREAKPEGKNVVPDKADTRKHDCENRRNERARMAGKEPMNNYNSGKADTKASLKRKRDDESVQSRVERLLDVFFKARDEHINRRRKETESDLNTVRFVRDSAENALTYLRANNMKDHEAIPDLEKWFAIMRDKATALTGGRGRHFDEKPPPAPRFLRPKKRSRFLMDSYRPRRWSPMVPEGDASS